MAGSAPATWPSGRISFRLLGRSNVDIIKTGGFKVSALEIERFRTHPAIAECAVVGIRRLGRTLSAAVELRPGELSLDECQQ
jgi:malonyl-CoA/methylmalonyl-CoA synthetase